MSEHTLRRIIIALAAIAIVWVGIRIGRFVSRGGPGDGGPLAAALQRLRDDTASAFTITSPAGDRVELQQTATGWTVNGMPADSAGVDRLRQTLRDATVGDLVATTAQNHPRLGVHADSAYILDIRAGDQGETTKLIIGRSGTRAGSGYVRLSDADETWQVSTDLRSAVARSINEWRDRVLLRIDTARVARIQLTRQGETYSLTRDSAGWSIDSDAAQHADSLATRNVLAELARFEASAVSPDTASFTGDDTRHITAFSTAGDTLANLEFAGREYIWRARRPGQPTLYDIASYRIDRLVPLRSDLTGRLE